MNKKIILSLSFIIIVIISIIAISIIKQKEVEKEEIDNIGLSIEDLTWKELTPKERNEIEEAKGKIDTLRKKVTLKWLISKWDIYYSEQEYTRALIKYMQVYNEIPNDQEVIKKIWDIYFNLKKYESAYEYYSQIIDYVNLDKINLVQSYINSSNVWSWNIIETSQKIDIFWLTQEQNFYYKNSMICSFDFHLCRKNFWDYFQKNNTETWTWVVEIELQDLKNIQTAFDNYANFQMEDLVYKSALISWAFFENWFYWAALTTSRSILESSPSYKPILKIAAKSSYELWNYIEAKQYLVDYNKLEPNDSEISYFLWIIYNKLNENILSTIHLRKAERIGYKNIIDIKRRLVFAYYELWQIRKIIDTFDDIISEKYEWINIADYNLAVYYNIVQWNIENATQYSIDAKKLYPESEIFYWYYAWLLLQKEELSDYQIKVIESDINKALLINDRNPMIVMVKWIFEHKKQNYTEAYKYFKNAIELDKNSDYSEIIMEWINKIPEEYK